MSADIGERRNALLRRAAYPIITFVAVVVAGVVGFVTLADIGFIEAAFWLRNPTSIELHFDDGGTTERATKAFSVVITALLVLSSAWIAQSVLSAAFGGTISEEVRKVRVKNEISELEDHVIVCGYGMFGRTVADRLKKKGVDVVVVERDTAVYDEATSEDLLAVQGDVRSEEVLKSVGVERARSVVGAVDDSNVNIETAIVVSQVAPDCSMVVRVGDEMYESLARRAGADEVVIPEVLTGENITDHI